MPHPTSAPTKPPVNAPGTSTCQPSGQRTSDNEPESRYRNRCAYRSNRTKHRADGPSDRTAHTGSFGGFGAEIGPGAGIRSELPLARLIRHDQINVLLAVSTRCR